MVVFNRSLARVGATALLLHSASATLDARASNAASCACWPENEKVTYIVVQMPQQNASTIKAVEDLNNTETGSSPVPVAVTNTTTTTYVPVPAADIDVTNPANVIPSTNVSVYYGAAPTNDSTSQGSGSINMTLAMGSGTVALEYISAVRNVSCSDDSVIVTFQETAAFQSALQSWSSAASLVLITNHLGNCDSELGRGFFKVDSVVSNYTNTIVCSASKQEIQDVAESCEFTFSLLPASTLTRRLTLDPSLTLNFAESLPETVIYSLPPYISVTAHEAAFTSSVTFSGYLRYNFWGFKLEKLYFDLDTTFSADVGLTAAVYEAYNNSFTYAPDDLTYSLVSVPGVLSIGPGVAFSIGLDLSTSAAVAVDADFGLEIPDGNVHIDLLDDSDNSATGWQPTYSSVVDISEKAAIEANVSAALTVELAIKVLGGLVDLSSGLTATPQFNNKFTLTGLEEVNGTSVTLPSNTTCDQGVHVESDFLFNLKGFATQWLSGTLYSVEVPVDDQCYTFN